MAASRPKPGNHERGWNDPPMFSFNSTAGKQQGAPKRQLNKRVAFPATSLPPPGHAVLNPVQGPPTGNTTVHDPASGIPIPKVIQAPVVGNSALPPALQVVTTTVVDQDAPLSPVLLPPMADTSMPVTVPLLVPAIVQPVKPQPDQSQDPAIQDERLADLLSRLQLQDDNELLKHVTANFDTVVDRYCKMLTEKASEDIKRKLEMFEEKWKNGNLSESVKIKISHLAAALVHEEVDKANHLHLALVVDHIAEVNQWMMGVKRLIQQQQLFLKEKDLLSGNTNNSEIQNSAIDSTIDPLVNSCDNNKEKSEEGTCDNDKYVSDHIESSVGSLTNEVGNIVNTGDNMVKTEEEIVSAETLDAVEQTEEANAVLDGTETVEKEISGADDKVTVKNDEDKLKDI